jgi:hypothetical protein
VLGIFLLLLVRIDYQAIETQENAVCIKRLIDSNKIDVFQNTSKNYGKKRK